jgi:hypothetical protein
MTKPHEEEWYREGTQTIRAKGVPGGLGADCSMTIATVEPNRGNLIACAPEMARMLLKLEWPMCNADYCYECGRKKRFGHAPTCALDALLRKAGAR